MFASSGADLPSASDDCVAPWEPSRGFAAGVAHDADDRLWGTNSLSMVARVQLMCVNASTRPCR